MNNDEKKKEEEIKVDTFIPGLHEIAENTPVKIYPQLFNVVGVEHGSQKILLYTKTHFTKEEAIEQFRLKAALKTGIPGDRWVVKVVTSISATDLEKEFTEIHNKIQAEKTRDKNKLMKDIIDNKDINLLHRSYERFNNYEIQLLHDALTGELGL